MVFGSLGGVLLNLVSVFGFYVFKVCSKCSSVQSYVHLGCGVVYQPHWHSGKCHRSLDIGAFSAGQFAWFVLGLL